MNDIHPTAIVKGEIGEGNTIGPFCYISENVKLGNNNKLISHVCLGTPGQWRGHDCNGPVIVGNDNEFHEFCQVQGSSKGNKTLVGDRGYFMGCAHIAHDCVIEDDVTMCNNATLGGHVRVMKGATLGFGATVHQKQIIGSYSMLGMGSIVPKGAEIRPGEKYAGNPVEHKGRNVHALKAHDVQNIGGEVKRFEEYFNPPEESRLIQTVGKLRDYMKTRDRKYKPERYEILRTVIEHLPYLNTNDAAELYNMAFSLCWQQHEDFKGDQVLIRQLLIDSIPGKTPPPTPAKGKIGWLVNHLALGTYAPYKHVYAYLSGMDPCEVIVHGNVREPEVNALRKMGHNIAQIKGPVDWSVEEIGKYCKERNIAVLISDIYTAVPAWCFKNRVATLQVYLSPGFQLFPADLVLLPETQERIPNTGFLSKNDYAFIPTAVVKDHLYQPRHRKKGKVFGVLSRAEKLSEDYLNTVVKILGEVPDSEFRFYGRGELPIEHPRIKSMGIENAHDALSRIDVYLDSYPTCGGLSVFEAMAHGVPVITLDHPSVHSWNQFKPCVVNTERQYITKAIEALDDARDIVSEGKEIIASRITNIPRAVSALYTELERAGWRK